jgi:hypothetical protein
MISWNPNITLNDILEHPDKGWDWFWISQNPNITLKDILKYPDKGWHWEWISQNKFLYDNNVFQREIKKNIKSRRKKLQKENLFGSLNVLVEKYIGYL